MGIMVCVIHQKPCTVQQNKDLQPWKTMEFVLWAKQEQKNNKTHTLRLSTSVCVCVCLCLCVCVCACVCVCVLKLWIDIYIYIYLSSAVLLFALWREAVTKCQSPPVKKQIKGILARSLTFCTKQCLHSWCLQHLDHFHSMLMAQSVS